MWPEGMGQDEIQAPGQSKAAQILSNSGNGFFSMNDLGSATPGPPRATHSSRAGRVVSTRGTRPSGAAAARAPSAAPGTAAVAPPGPAASARRTAAPAARAAVPLEVLAGQALEAHVADEHVARHRQLGDALADELLDGFEVVGRLLA